MSQSKCREREAKQDEVVEIDPSWVKEVLGNIEMSRQHKRPTKPSIFKVPAILRSRDPDAYVPKLVSIGPYHRGDTSLQAMEEIKWQILDHLLSKAPKNRIHRYLKKMLDLEAKARSYYSEIINLESRRFAEMLLLDGCFIIQLFIPYEREVLSDLLNNDVFLEAYLCQDLLLLENQLPYFIINDLLSILDIPGLESFPIQRVMLQKLRYLFPSSTEPAEEFDVAHILHLLYESITRSSGPESPPNEQITMVTDAHEAPFVGTSSPESGPQSSSSQQSRSRSRCSLSPQFLQRLISRSRCLLSLQCLKRSRSRSISQRFLSPRDFLGVPSATELAEAGVKIKVSKAENFLDISFNKKKGLLEIPIIQIFAPTNLIFRNLVALERCYVDVGMKITCYSLFVDCIINTDRDVALLIQAGVIGRGPGNDTDIALLFNHFSKDVVVDINENYLAQVIREVRDYCNSRWNKWRGRLMHDYFTNPWAIISVIAAAVLLALTIVQAVVSILSYTQQINSSDRPHP